MFYSRASYQAFAGPIPGTGRVIKCSWWKNWIVSFALPNLSNDGLHIGCHGGNEELPANFYSTVSSRTQALCPSFARSIGFPVYVLACTIEFAINILTYLLL